MAAKGGGRCVRVREEADFARNPTDTADTAELGGKD